MADGAQLRVDYVVGIPDLLALVARNPDLDSKRLSVFRTANATVIGLLVAVFVLLAAGPERWWQALATGGFACVLWLLVLPHDVRGRALKRMDTRLRDPSNASMTGPRTLVVQAQGLDLSYEHVEARYHWPVLQRIVATPQRLFVYVSGMQAHVVPLAAADATRVLAAVRSHAPTLPIVEEAT